MLWAVDEVDLFAIFSRGILAEGLEFSGAKFGSELCFAGLDNSANSIFNFVSGQRAIGGLEAAGDDAGFVVSGDLFAAIEATECGVLEEWSGAVADGLFELFPGDVFGENEVEVAVDSGEAWDGSEVAFGLEELFEYRESEFGCADAVVEFAGVEN